MLAHLTLFLSDLPLFQQWKKRNAELQRAVMGLHYLSKRTWWNRCLLVTEKKTTPHSSKNHCHYSYASGNILQTWIISLYQYSSTLSFLPLITFELGSLWLSYASVPTAGHNVQLAQPATAVTQQSGEWYIAPNSIWQAKESINVCTCTNFLRQFFNV